MFASMLPSYGPAASPLPPPCLSRRPAAVPAALPRQPGWFFGRSTTVSSHGGLRRTSAPSRSKDRQDQSLRVLRVAVAASGLRLVIAEKPSVAQLISQALCDGKVVKREQGAYRFRYGNVDFAVVAARGHLIEIQAPQKFEVPFFGPFTLKVIKENGYGTVVKQITSWAQKAEGLINACDAGREGELIFRRIQRFLKMEQKPFQRLWLQSLTASAIREAVARMRPGREYDNLAISADCRSRWDWWVGINGTRALNRGNWLTPKSSVGRVMTPTLSMVVDREKEILDFKPQQYEVAQATFAIPADKGSSATYVGEYSTKDKAPKETTLKEALKDWRKGKEATVLEDKRSVTSKGPKTLPDLTDLQRDCSRLHGMSPKETTQIAQKLYEMQLATYPRTDSRYLPEDHVNEVKELLLHAFGQADESTNRKPSLWKAAAQRVDVVRKHVFDKTKVTDHFAIIPTKTGLTEALRKQKHAKKGVRVLMVIAQRFLEAFLPPAKYAVSCRKTQVEDYVFLTKQTILTEPGFLAASGKAADAKALSTPLAEGTLVHLTSSPKVTSKETTPPDRYNQASLVGAMETCGRKVTDCEMKQAMTGGIGTAATRAYTVDKLLKQNWLVPATSTSTKTGRLKPTREAMDFIANIRGKLQLDTLSRVEMTGEWEKRLKSIQEGKEKKDAMEKEMQSMVVAMVQRAAKPRVRGKVEKKMLKKQSKYKGLKVAQLQLLLREKGLKVSGVKAALVDRLLEAEAMAPVRAGDQPRDSE